LLDRERPPVTMRWMRRGPWMGAVRHTRAPRRAAAGFAPPRRARARCLGGLAVVVTLALVSASSPARAIPIDGIHNIQHVVMIMQENRSFDNYFGTYPGANGIPHGVCLPFRRHCVKPFHDARDENLGGEHGLKDAITD